MTDNTIDLSAELTAMIFDTYDEVFPDLPPDVMFNDVVWHICAIIREEGQRLNAKSSQPQ